MEDSTLTDLRQLADQAREARKPFEADWLMNIAYYQGDQWVYVAGGNLKQPTLAKNRVRFTDNRILGLARTEIAKMTKDRPIWEVHPASGDDSDLEGARLGERILDHYWSDLKLRRRLRSALLWARVSSAGFWKMYWDSTAGDSVSVIVGPDGQPIKSSSGGLMRADDPQTSQLLSQLPAEMTEGFSEKKIALGKACVEVRSPFEILPDPLAEEGGLDEAEWVIEEAVRSQEYVRRRYGKEIEPKADAVAGIAESRMLGGATASTTYKGVRIFELWEQPSSKHAGGRRVVWTDDEVLSEDDNPYGFLPYAMFTGVPVPGRFWPTTTVEQLRPLNLEMNKTRSQVRENAARIGNPSLLKNRLANVNYSGVPGEVVEYDGTIADSVPAYLRPPEMPAYVQNELDRMEGSLNEVSGQHEVTRGNVPAGVTAASAINLLMEGDDTRLANDIEDVETALGEAGGILLKLTGRFMDDERVAMIGGEDERWDVVKFKGTQLGENHQVTVEAGSGMPRSKAAKQAAMHEVLQLMIQYGLEINPRDLRRFLRAYEVGGLERLFGDLSADERQVNHENRRLYAGEQIPLNSFDNDLVHIEGHTEEQKSPQWARMPDEIKGVWEAHVAEHRQRYIDTQNAMVEAGGNTEESGDEPAREPQE